MLNNLESRIMKDLNFGFSKEYFSAKRYGVTQEEFNLAVRNLGNIGYVCYDEHKHKHYKGDVRRIRITEKGKREFK